MGEALTALAHTVIVYSMGTLKQKHPGPKSTWKLSDDDPCSFKLLLVTEYPIISTLAS